MAIETLTGNAAVIWVDTAKALAASLDVGAGNSGVRYTADAAGVGGNSIRVAHVADAGANASTTVSVAGNDITVTLGTGATAGVVNATAQQVMDAVNAHAGASALVTASLVGDGTGTAAGQAMTALAGGADKGPANFEAIGYQRGLSHEQTREIIDASHKNSDHAQSVYGRQSSTMSLDALIPDPDIGAVATHQALYDAQNIKKTVMVELRQTGSAGTVARRAAEALVGTISSEYPDNDVSSISVEFTLQEPLALVA